MLMDYLQDLITPAFVFCVIVVLGYFLGKIKVFSVSLDVAGILIVAIGLGYILSRYFNSIFHTEFGMVLSNYSKLGSSLFASVIGITAGFGINRRSAKKSLIYFSIGAIAVLAGTISAKLIAAIDENISRSVILGVLCGALTSTPGLASVCEMENVVPELATIGYGIAYLFGVVGVVLYVQIAAKKLPAVKCDDNVRNKSKYQGVECLVILCMVSVIGQIIGSINIPLANFTLGTTGGTVICGIVSGMFINRLCGIKGKIEDTLPIFRNFGLVLFIAGNGVAAGRQINANLELKWFVYGAIITIVSLAVSEIIGRVIFRNKTVDRMALIAGAMTSTPAIGVVTKKTTDESILVIYSLSYLGALMSILFLIRIL